MKLISMTDFILSDEVIVLDEGSFIKTIEYAKFLKQPLKLEMFVPCGGDQDILEPPKFYYKYSDLKRLDRYERVVALQQNNRVKLYEKAKLKCLFKGFSNPNVKEKTFVLSYKNQGYWIPKDDNIEGFMQNFIPNEVELTETAIKYFKS